jgi:succinate dehydrogenase/fumarate reductase flavoprotein subunit
VESGCKTVLIVDKCPREWVGGNGYFTAGAHRTVHGGLCDLLPIVRNVSPDTAETIDLNPYTAEDFTSDLMRLGNGRSDPGVVKAVVENSRETIDWLASYVGIPFVFSFNRQAYEVDGRQKFWGGMALSVQEGGKGLIAGHQRMLKQKGVEVWFETPAVELVVDSAGCISGVVVRRDGQPLRVRTCAVILAAGGFESNAELRAKHLGTGWEKARVSF